MIRAAHLKALLFLVVVALAAFVLAGTAAGDPASPSLPTGWTWDDGVAVSPSGWTWDKSGALTSPDGWTWDDGATLSSPLGATFLNDTSAVPLQTGWTRAGADVSLPDGWTWDDSGAVITPTGWTWDDGVLTAPS